MSEKSKKSFKMPPCNKIESWSLVFAIVSLLISSLSSLLLITWFVKGSISMANFLSAAQKEYSPDIKTAMAVYTIQISSFIIFLLSFMVVAIVFLIILIKGVLTKNSHLVKAYFIYGVTMNTLTVIFGIMITVAAISVGFIILLGCLLYGLILFMIKKTYLKLAAAEHEECCNKKTEPEKTIAIRL